MGTCGVMDTSTRPGAINAGRAVPSATRGERRMPGEAGTWIFLFGDMLVFGVFFATFMYERGRAPQLFDESRQTLSIGIGLTNTLILLTSSLFVVTAIRAIRSSQKRAAQLLLAGAIACGAAFVGLKAVEYTAKVNAGHVPDENTFYLYFFILTGIHLIHVLIGIAVLVLLLTQARRTELSAQRVALVEGGACFWHLVDLLWIVLFPLLYLVS
jgi:nitric oxide reductase NorE protein